MIKVQKRDPPEGFKLNVQDAGERWLTNAVNRDKPRPQDYWNYWRPCRDAVEAMFESRCGYCATWIPEGQIEHFISWKACKISGEHQLAYQWDNYRWSLPQFNTSKGACDDIANPFEIEDAWFEIDLYTLDLVVHAAEIPADVLQRVNATIQRLRLKDGPIVRKQRELMLEVFRNGTRLPMIEKTIAFDGASLETTYRGGPGQTYAKIRSPPGQSPRTTMAHRLL